MSSDTFVTYLSGCSAAQPFAAGAVAPGTVLREGLLTAAGVVRLCSLRVDLGQRDQQGTTLRTVEHHDDDLRRARRAPCRPRDVAGRRRDVLTACNRVGDDTAGDRA